MTGPVVQTKMAAAFTKALESCKEDGRNPGRVGRRILTNNARHNVRIENPKKQFAAESAGK